METLLHPEDTPSSIKSIKDSEKADKPQKINYKQKNLDLIQKIKEKKQKQADEKEKELKKEQELKDKLKKKILAEAQKVRQQKQKENSKVKQDDPPSIVQKSKRVFCQSLPKIVQQSDKDKFKKRHSEFLNSLSQGIKTKKDLEQNEKKKKQEKYQKLKQDMGFNKVESKLSKMIEENKEVARPSSADRAQSAKCIPQKDPHSSTTKNFQDKYQIYLQNIKKKKIQEQIEKQQLEKKMQKRKEKLKDYVMTTVKKNVLDGVYEDENQQKKDLKRKSSIIGTNQQIDQQDDEQSGDDQTEDKPKKKRKKMRNFPHVVDINEWRKKNKLEPDTQVFIVTGGYGGIKKALYSRGWVQNPDPSSPCFNMKWVLQSKECEYNSLQEDQIVNHFQKNGAITTKVGLSKNLRGLQWVAHMNSDDFYPKCYDLCDDEDVVAFQDQFKLCKAITVLKLYMKLTSLKNSQEAQKMRQRANIALDILNRNIVQLDDLIDKKKVPQLISKKQWQILAEDQLNTEGLAKKKHQEWLMSINAKYNDTKDKKKKKQKKKKTKEGGDVDEEKQELEENQYDQFTKQVDDILSKYEEKYPQYNLTNTNNIWILKPAGLSRGRGITCYNNFVQIQDHIKSKQSQWVAQKYIQNPLIVCKRKFDIRLWVLVTSFNPLMVWKYDECYIRFSALDYNYEDVNNKFIHLTNNSIASLHKNFQKSEIKGNMFSQDQFSKYLEEKQGYNVFQEKIRDQMTDIIKWSMMAAQEHIQHRKNSHQLYGYDFMVDEDYKVWLIEINSSPSMDYSTHITTRLVKSCLEDVIRVVVDYNSASKKEKKKVDTGGFKLIYKGQEIPDKPITTGLNLGIQGVQMKKSSKKPLAKSVSSQEANKNL